MRRVQVTAVRKCREVGLGITGGARVLAALVLVACGGGDGGGTGPSVATVEITPPSRTAILTGDTLHLTAVTKDARGTVMTGQVIAWTSSNSSVATATSDGTVIGVAAGSTNITATSAGRTSSALVITVSAPAVTTIDVAPQTTSVEVSRTVQLTATPKDQSGRPMTGQTITWSSAQPTLATVDGAGLVSGVAVSATPVAVTAAVGARAGQALVTVTPATASSVVIDQTLPSRLIPGDSLQLTVTVRDAKGNILVGRPVTWTSTGPAIASLSTTGLLIANAGGGCNITAQVDGITRTLAVTVTSVLASERFGFALGDQPTNNSPAGYAPSASFSYNGVTGASSGILITRAGTGSYRIQFHGLGATARLVPASNPVPVKEIVLASSYGGGGIHCVPNNWGRFTSPRDLDTFVACANAAGVATDSRFTVLVIGEKFTSGNLAFAQVSNTGGAASPVPFASWSSGTAPTATNVGVGQTTLKFGLPIATTDTYNTFLAAHATFANSCRNLGRSNDVMSVQCTDPAGNNAHTDFDALVLGDWRPGARFGFAFANNFAVASYPPNPTFLKNSSGLGVLATRSAVGTYRITFSGLGATRPETVIVTPFSLAAYCSVGSMSLVNAGADLAVDVLCYNSAGALVDSYYTVLVVE